MRARLKAFIAFIFMSEHEAVHRHMSGYNNYPQASGSRRYMFRHYLSSGLHIHPILSALQAQSPLSR